MDRTTALARICVMVLIGMCATAARATTCADLLGNNSYDCTIVSEASPTPVQSCFDFSTPGSLSGKFDLHADGVTLGCTCQPAGNAKRPKFNASKTFDCVGSDGPLAVHIGGKVGKSKISKGHREDSSGAGAVLACSLRTSPCFECFGGETDCSGLCVDLTTDPGNCGACDNECVAANAVAGCSGGSCTIASCNPGFENCDSNPVNGCEVNTSTNPNNCGGCGIVCGVGKSCFNGLCL